MTTPPSDTVRAELIRFLESDPTRLGDVYRLTARGLQADEIASQLGISTSGFVSNYRTYLRTILEGMPPQGQTMVPQAAGHVRRLIDTGNLTFDARNYCTRLVRELASLSKGALPYPAHHRSDDGSLSTRSQRPSTGGEEPTKRGRSGQPSAIGFPAPTAGVSAAVRELVRNDASRLGQVFRLTEDGLDPDEIANRLGVRTSNFVSNNRIIARTLIEGVSPRGDSLKRAAAAKARSLVRAPGLGADARDYLGQLVAILDPNAPQLSRLSRPASQPAPTPEPAPAMSRVRLLGMLDSLVQRIELETEVTPSDYETLAARPDVIAALSRHVGASRASKTFLALYECGQLDLTLESFVVRFGRALGIGEQDRQMAEDRLMYFSELD